MKAQEFEKILTRPLMKKGSIAINVKRFFTDVNGVIVDKSTVPANLQTSYPVFMFGEYDRQGGYYQALKNTPVLPGYFYLCSFVWGINNPFFFGFTGLATIQREIKPGDICQVYTDDFNAPNYFIWIVLSSDTRSLASIFANAIEPNDPKKWPDLNVTEFQYFTDNVEQWSRPIQNLVLDNTGTGAGNFIEPYAMRTPQYEQTDFILIKWRFAISQYRGLNTYIEFDTEKMGFVFNLLKK